jgi:hypothetical protein
LLKTKKDLNIARLVLPPFKDLDLYQIGFEDEFCLQVNTLEGKKYNLVFKKRINYLKITEYSLFEVLEIRDNER